MLKLKVLLYCFYIIIQLTFYGVWSKAVDSEVNRIKAFSKKIQNWVSESYDPCKLFVDYASGGEGEKRVEEIATDEVTKQWINSNDESDLTLFEKKAKTFFKSCVNSKTSEYMNSNSLKWPITESNWKPNDTMWTEYIGNELDFSYSWPIISTDTNKRELGLSYGFTLFRDVYDKPISVGSEGAKIKKAMKDRGVSDEILETILLKMIEASENIITAMRDCPRNEDWYVQIKLKKLKNDIPNINWEKIFENYKSDNLNVNDDTQVMIFDQMCTMDYLRAVTKDVTASYNFFIWVAIQANLDKQCLDKTLKYFTPVVLRRFKDAYIDDEDIERYNKVGKKAVEIIIDVKGKSVMDFKESYTEMFLKEQKSVIEFLNNDLNVKSIDKSYEDISIEEDDFAKNVEKLETFANQKGRYSCVAPVFECMVYERVFVEMANQHNKPFYTAFSNQLPDLLRILVQNNPKILFKPEKVDELAECYNKNKYDISVAILRFQPIDSILMSKIFKTSLEALKKYLNEETTPDEKKLLTDIGGFTPEQSFFIHAAHDYSSKDFNIQGLFYKSIVNMKDFANAFNCPVGSAMNPSSENCYRM